MPSVNAHFKQWTISYAADTSEKLFLQPKMIPRLRDMPTQIEKLQAHAAYLLDAFIQLRERYALLEPMLFSEVVARERGAGLQARGFRVLQNSLFLSCSQDIAKLTLDMDDRTPSLANLICALTDERIREKLREQFASWKIPPIEEAVDPEIAEALRRMELREEAERQEQFDNLYCEVTMLWAKLSTSAIVKAYRTIRDKLSAHIEVRLIADKYQFTDVGSLGLKWGDFRKTIDEMQRLVEITGLLIRNAGFAWDMLDEQLSEASNGFWGLPLLDTQQLHC
jgi:hypothetical protein